MNKQYYVVKDKRIQNSGTYPFMVMNDYPAVIGFPFLKPNYYPGFSNYDIKVELPDMSFVIRVPPHMGQRIFSKLYKEEIASKTIEKDSQKIKVSVVRPSIPYHYNIGHRPFYQALNPILSTPAVNQQVNMSDMAGRPMTGDEILRELRKNVDF